AGRPLWDATPLALPRREDIGQTPGPIPASTERHSGACPSLWADANGFSWRVVKGQPLTAQTLSVTSTLGPAAVGWSASTSAPWLQVKPASGDALPAQVSVSVDVQAVPPGVNRANLTFTTGGGLTPITLPVEVVAEDAPSFKRFLPYLPRRALGAGR
ncbi:MAG: BACON domain-containing carbohydrate-binding protein, partial [Chloroflexota bacterium]